MKDVTKSKLILKLTRLLVVVFAVAIALSSSLGNSQAAQKGNRPPFLAVPHHGPGSVHLSVSHMVFWNSGTHYLYVDDGTTPDSIDVYAVTRTLTHVGNFPNNASASTAGIPGTTTLAVAKMNSAHGACVLLLDGGGFVDSFSVMSGGGLSAEVSHVSDGASATDVAIAEDGNTAYVSNFFQHDLESYSIGSGCGLKLLHTLATPTQDYNQFALVSPTRLVAPDSNSTTIDTYALGSDGTITFLKSVAGQFSGPNSIAIQKVQTGSGSVTNVFTGSGNTSISQGSQYYRNTGDITFLKGSPSTDPKGSGGVGEAVIFDSRDSFLIEGELFTDALAVYIVKPGVPGTPGRISFKEHIPLPNPNSEDPIDYAQLGSTLFVNMGFNGDLVACTMSSSGVSGCATVATLTNTGGTEEGLALL